MFNHGLFWIKPGSTLGKLFCQSIFDQQTSFMLLVPYNHFPLLSLNFYLSDLHEIYTHPLVISDGLQMQYDQPIILNLQSSCIGYRCSMIGHLYPPSSHLAWVINMVQLANVTPAIICNDSLAVLVYIYVLPDSKFSGAKKMPSISSDQQMNLDTKIVVEGDKGEPMG